VTAKRPELIVWSTEPLLVETPLDLLCDSHVTPTELFFVRNHGPVPTIDADAFSLRVDGLVRTPLQLSLEDLKRSFPETTVAATLVCAGNRRAELASVRPIPGETPWGAGAIGNAEWSGVRLRDVLAAAGFAETAEHVAFAGHDATPEAPDFGGSIPLAQALAADVLLAYAMNGEPLPAEHGFPLRVVVPGYIGARSVKWLASVRVQEEPSSNYFQAKGYRLLPEDVPLAELSLNSVLCRARVAGRIAHVQGYAVAGGDAVVERVEISPDGGATWLDATLTPESTPGSWRLWEAELELSAGPNEAVVRAFDSAGNTQPQDPETVWNTMGYMNNARQRTVLTV
jgi:sulfite oxidase